MNNKIFLKIGFIVILIVLIYISFITFVISPKITKYLTDSEIEQAKTQLSRITSIVNSKEEFLKNQKKIKIQENKKNIKNISHTAYNFMQTNYELFKQGKISKDEAIKSSIVAISKIVYGFEDDYIYILDKKGNLVYHPDEKYAGKNIYYVPDANGRLFVIDLIKNVLEKGSDYSRYSWGRLNSDFISEKIVYSIYFEPFDLIVSTGVYIESINNEIFKQREEILQTIYPLINSIVLGDKGYIFIMNDDNEMILHPNKSFLNTDMSGFQQPGTEVYMVEELKKAYAKGKAWEYKWNTPLDKENYIYDKISWVNYNKFFDWYIVSSIYRDDLEIKSKEINAMTMNISIVLLLVLLTIAMFFIKKLLKPISIMSKNVNLVESGNLNVRNNLKVKDELGLLSNQFDKMLDYIESNTKNLEEKVQERTASLKHKLYHDEHTGLKNREALIKDIKKNNFIALSFIDINGFDDLNELYGFEVGNEILLEISDILRTFANENELYLYKLDADIFALLDTNIASFISYDKTLEKIQDVFKKEVAVKSLEIDVDIYVTIGTSISQDDPIKSSNIALKRAKELGLRYIVYNKDIDTKDNIKKSMYWRDKIKNAIDEDKVVAFHQPIFDKNRNIVKYETLMRISDKVDGQPYFISPGNFMDIAIKTKQYFKLNQIVIEKTLTSMDKINNTISINISFADLLNIEFNELIERLIDKLSHENRRRVVFEILESDLISDYKVLDEFILKYREKGIKIAIDDFGTGFSNFSHILEMKPDYIKIDGSLIKNIDSDEKSYEIVKSIIDFSKSLNIMVIGEYIHSKEVYDIVKELGVDEFQGYFLGEPEPLI